MFQRISTKEAFEQVYPILAEAFPVTELRTKEKQMALLKKEAYRLFAVLDDQKEVCGVIAAWELADDFLYMEHFAILPQKRNGGFGGKVLDCFTDWYRKAIVLEVEVPNDDLTRRRVGFYQRHGFIYHEYPYLQPPMREGQDFVPLRLMTKPNPIDQATYERCRCLIYREVYQYYADDACRIHKK